MHRFFGVLCVLTTPLLLNAGNDDVRKELKALEGTWKTVGLQARGRAFPKALVFDFTFIIGADGKSIGRMGKSEYQAKVSVDPKKNPKTINNVHETGEHKGKTQYGIYKQEGEKWIVSMTPPGAAESDRPKSFDTKDTRNVVFIFERVKEDKKR
jgi:uncharacterized protein (TIGR03067 family)